MKQGIHPDYHKITIQMTDGTKYETYSTWGKEGDTLQLDVDPKTHPAWVGGVNMRKTGQLEKFENRFKHLANTGPGNSKKGEQPAAKKADKKADEKKAEPKAEAKVEAKKDDAAAAAE